MDKISVIVPVYNVEKYVGKCLESIIRQTYKELEIIVIDDGSTDGGGAICNEFQKKDNRIRVIHQENQGLSEARNRGIELATGKYLSFIDSDDYLSYKLYEDCIQIFEKHDVDIVVFGHQRIDEHGRTQEIVRMKESYILDSEDALKDLIRGKIQDIAWDKIYKAELFAGIRYPRGRLCEDLGTTYKVIDRAKKIYCIDKVYYFYLKRKGSITFRTSAKRWVDCLQLQKERYNYFLLRNEKLVELLVEAECLWVLGMYVEGTNNKLEKSITTEAKKYLDDNKEAFKSNQQLMSHRSIRCYYFSPWLCCKIFPLIEDMRKRRSVWRNRR